MAEGASRCGSVLDDFLHFPERGVMAPRTAEFHQIELDFLDDVFSETA